VNNLIIIIAIGNFIGNILRMV